MTVDICSSVHTLCYHPTIDVLLVQVHDLLCQHINWGQRVHYSVFGFEDENTVDKISAINFIILLRRIR